MNFYKNSDYRLLKFSRELMQSIISTSVYGQILGWRVKPLSVIFQLKTNGNSGERSSCKDWNEMEKLMAHKIPIILTMVEWWQHYGCGRTLFWIMPKGDQDRLLWRHNFLTKVCSSIMNAYIVWASKIHGRVSILWAKMEVHAPQYTAQKNREH